MNERPVPQQSAAARPRWPLLVGVAVAGVAVALVAWLLMVPQEPRQMRPVGSGPEMRHQEATSSPQEMEPMVAAEDVAVAEPPAAPAQAAAPQGPRRQCTFRKGDRLAYEVTMKVDSSVDLSALTRAAGSQPLGIKVDPPRKVTLDVVWRMDLQAIQVRDDGSTVLAVKIEKGRQKTRGLSELEGRGGDMSPVFLVHLGQNCALLEFAWREGVDLRGARSQQALLAGLQWQYPTADMEAEGGLKFEAKERDATGVYKARYALVETDDDALIVRNVLSYEKLFKSTSSIGETTMQSSGTGLKVRPGTGQWFESLELEQSSSLQLKGAQLGQMSNRVVARSAAPREVELTADPASPAWIWGDLFELEFPKEAEKLADVPGWIRALSFEQALAEYSRLVQDPKADFRDFVFLMRDWVRAHPEGLPQIMAAIKDNRFPQKYGESAVFYALSLTQIPEAGKALQSMMTDDSFGSMNQSRAALALADSPILPDGYMDDLLRLTRGNRSGSVEDKDDVQSLSPMLGIVAKTQVGSNPEAARMARQELMTRLAEEKEPWRVESALVGVGNIGDDSIIDPVRPFLNHEDPSVRIAAAEALRQVSPEKAAQLYEPALTAETDPNVRGTLVHSYWNQAFHSHQRPPESVVNTSISALGTETSLAVLEELVQLLALAAERGDVGARQALADRMQAEMAKAQRNTKLLMILGRYAK